MPNPPREIRDFARQVLGGTTLADKLAPPGPLSDDRPGDALTVDVPGRPPGLALRDGRARVPFPSDGKLADAEARGIVLHFFANHELLALELMALALLRFPGAEPGFRRGLVGVMREEQAHLRLYLERMEAAGVAFGDVPVNAFFWDQLAGVSSPASFVAGLSLTFEQANLDFAAHYAAAFRAVGDEATAAVLDQVLADEIGHVGHGLRWFDRWRLPGPFWDRWVEALPGTLAPVRAKGRGFVREPRIRAGFDEDTIARLEVTSGSKGRLPFLYRFDPEVEADVAGQPRTAAGARIAADLELLPAYLAGKEDAALVGAAPRRAFLQGLRDAGFELPERVDVVDDRRWGGFRPWGWSPRVCAELAPHGGPTWDPAWARFSSKAWAAGLDVGDDPRLAPAEDRPVACRSVAEVREAVRALGDRPFVLKAPYATAGRDRRWTFDEGWVERTLAAQQAVVVEPWLERVADLSFQATGSHLDGWGRFFADGRGVYRGTWLGRPFDGLPRDVVRFAYGDGADPEWIPGVFRRVAAVVGRALGDFPGGYGVDAFVYRRPDGLRLRPLVELNARVTMGRVALAVGRHVRAGVPARFDLVRPADVRERPVVRREGLLVDGVIALTDPATARQVVAVLSVGPDVQPT